MNGKRLIVIVSLLIIIVGGTVLLLRFSQDDTGELAKETYTESYEVTEEDYKANPKYILEELIVSNGKHFQYPQVQQVWDYTYYGRSCYVEGALELSQEQYDGVINQLDNELNILRHKEGQYKDQMIRNYWLAFVDHNEDKLFDRKKLESNYYEAEVTYSIKVPDIKYQTLNKGQTVMCIFMIKKYNSHYMFFCSNAESELFYYE